MGTRIVRLCLADTERLRQSLETCVPRQSLGTRLLLVFLGVLPVLLLIHLWCGCTGVGVVDRDLQQFDLANGLRAVCLAGSFLARAARTVAAVIAGGLPLSAALLQLLRT